MFSIIPFKAPFQPEWMHPMILFFGSYNKMGIQSAVSIPIPTFVIFVTNASPDNLFLIEFGVSKITTWLLCFWF